MKICRVVVVGLAVIVCLAVFLDARPVPQKRRSERISRDAAEAKSVNAGSSKPNTTPGQQTKPADKANNKKEAKVQSQQQTAGDDADDADEEQLMKTIEENVFERVMKDLDKKHKLPKNEYAGKQEPEMASLEKESEVDTDQNIGSEEQVNSEDSDGNSFGDVKTTHKPHHNHQLHSPAGKNRHGHKHTSHHKPADFSKTSPEDDEQTPLVREKRIRNRSYDKEMMKDEERSVPLHSHLHKNTGPNKVAEHQLNMGQAANRGCELPMPVTEQPDFFMTKNDKKLMMLEPGDLASKPEGFLLEGLTSEDRGNNKENALQVDFDVPHQLAAITFPQAGHQTKDRFAVGWRDPSTHVWHFVKEADQPHKVKLFHFHTGARLAGVHKKVQSIRLYPEDWGEHGAHIQKPSFYECSTN